MDLSANGGINVTGDATQGKVLQASIADPSGLSNVVFQWLRGGAPIGGATAAAYTLSEADVGAAISVRVNYTNASGQAESVTSASSAAVANVNDAPAGSLTLYLNSAAYCQGATLYAVNRLTDADGMGTITWQWYRNGSVIAGAASDNYKLAEADVGASISVRASWTDGHGTAETVVSPGSPAIQNVNDAPAGIVFIRGSGPIAQNSTVIADNSLQDADGLGPVSYQWLREGNPIPGATGDTYQLAEADVGYHVSVRASYIDGHGTAEHVDSVAMSAVANVNDAPTGKLDLVGLPVENSTLAVKDTLADADGMGPVSYQWLRNWSPIPGATASTYVLTSADAGASVAVRASYTDGHGKQESVESYGWGVSRASEMPGDHLPSGAVTIEGSALQGQVLTAASTLADADGLGQLTYQWLRDGRAIDAATGSTYTLANDDVGASISVRASYVDKAGFYEQVHSQGTPAVANLNDGPTGSVTVGGVLAEGGVLTVTSTLADPDGLGTVSYQWLRGGQVIDGATGAAYTVTAADIGASISVRAAYTDGHGTAESVASNAVTIGAAADHPPTGGVAVSGNAVQDSQLSASNTLADADGMGTVSYQWLRDGVAVGGATGGIYKLTEADVGHPISVRASYTDGHGNAQAVTSPATPSIANVNDAPTGWVVMSDHGDRQVTLTAENTLADADGMGVVSYQWLRSGQPIAGATSATYRLTADDVGKGLSVLASYVDGHGTLEQVRSGETVPPTTTNAAPTGAVAIDGAAVEGATLTATNTIADADGIYGGIGYRWLRDGQEVVGWTSSTYVLGNSDVGARISVLAVYQDNYGRDEQLASSATAPVANVNDAPTGWVQVYRSDIVPGNVLTAANTLDDADGMGAVTYQWLRAGVPIDGMTGDTYTLTQADVGQEVTVRASYTDGHGTRESATSYAVVADNRPTGSVAISGNAVQNSQLTASNTLADIDGMGTVTYQWVRDGHLISGATGSTYTLVQADVGYQINVNAYYTDGRGNAEMVTSGATATVSAVQAPPPAPPPPSSPPPAQNDHPTGAVTLAGQATQGQSLSAASTLQDKQGMGPLSYQWQRDGADIAGATGSSYQLAQADVGKHISVGVSYKDGAGNAESAHSGASEAVANVNDAPTGRLMVVGTATEDSALAAVSTLADADGMGTLQYQWLRDGQPIDGATGAQYTLQHADVGSIFSVQASYTDGFGAHESVTSAASAAVGGSGAGGAGSLVVGGTAGDDNLHAGAGNDLFVGGPGNDTLDGGAGLDTVVYEASAAQFEITMTPTGFTVKDKAGAGGSDQLLNVERLVFGDSAVALDINGNAGMGFRLYQAVFDRAPDLGGMGYWIDALDKGMALRAVAQSFMDSAEFKTMYGAQPDNAAFLAALYKYALHREPDAAGIAWWDGAIKAGAVSMVDVLVQFSESAENQAQVIGSEQHGIAFTPWH